ncbi:MAG: ATP-dependent DNA helicase RecG [Thermoleophilia bacterium]|nr:ATP-dependent DNA helicase RecG [Thermoleophilia bacterium]
MIDTPPFGGGAGDRWPEPPPAPRPGLRWWSAPLSDLPGVTAQTEKAAAALGLQTVEDLLSQLPSRHEHYEQAHAISTLMPGEETTVRARLKSITVRPTRRRRLRMVRARVEDESGALDAIWFNQDYLARVLQPDDWLLLRGKVDSGRGRIKSLSVKAHEVLGRGASEGLHTQGLVPTYPGSEALPPRRVRELVDKARPMMRAAPESLPYALRRRLRVPHVADALHAAHFPASFPQRQLGRGRLVLEELLVLQLGLLLLRRAEQRRAGAPVLEGTDELVSRIVKSLPFTMTVDQERCRQEIAADLADSTPMRRLLQGEVGSGKTLVATLAICQAVEAGYQAALLVPTETLAEQHLATLDQQLMPAGITPVLITGKVARRERESRLLEVRSGTAQVIVGTQALFSSGVDFDRLGLVIVDEQHRFGVEQRQVLAENAERAGGGATHLLYMTATPIPRTLALTAFGELAVSVIRDRPPGRQPVATEWVREDAREDAYERVRAELRAGRQAYVICPRVSEGETEDEGRAATAEADRLREGAFAAFEVGLVHGAQRTDDKRAAMAAFDAGRTDVLVATTVVEVGIDVPNATVMIIEDAERFGLAQLHQLRGRVGRGEHAGRCIAFGEPGTEEAERRLEAFAQTNDGFRLAELDLEIRGEGSMMGRRQAGATDLRFARVGRDLEEVERARAEAIAVLEGDPGLSAAEHGPLRAAVQARFVHIPRLLDA